MLYININIFLPGMSRLQQNCTSASRHLEILQIIPTRVLCKAAPENSSIFLSFFFSQMDKKEEKPHPNVMR